jgi:hypothetical protein
MNKRDKKDKKTKVPKKDKSDKKDKSLGSWFIRKSEYLLARYCKHVVDNKVTVWV